jgi:hypothetical protein
MKNLGFAAAGYLAATGFAAAIVGLAAPAQAQAPEWTAPASSVSFVAGIDHHSWIDQITPDVNVPKVDTSVRHSGR